MDLIWFSNQSHGYNWSRFKIMQDLLHLEAIPSQYHIIIVLLYIITAIIALLGNSITVITLLNGKKSAPDLSKLTINLGLSHLIMTLFCIPFTYTIFMFNKWLFDPSFCPIVLSLQSLFSIC